MSNLRLSSYDEIRGFNDKPLSRQWSAFVEQCNFYLDEKKSLRPGYEWIPQFRIIAQRAVQLKNSSEIIIRDFIKHHFLPYELVDNENQSEDGFITGYYQPELRGSLFQTEDFTCPIYARPSDLISFENGINKNLKGYYGGCYDENQNLIPYQTRQDIELDKSGKFKAIMWVQDYVEAFLLHVQGSALVRTGDGREYKLTYAGRNGHPYTSIGKLLIEGGYINQNIMSLKVLKQWLRDHGQDDYNQGRSIMWQNRSFIFFNRSLINNNDKRPIGGSGLGLNPLISVAADRKYWPYGTFFWIEMHKPIDNYSDSAFSSLVINQDTGTAIVGRSRFDLYMGSGSYAGEVAGNIRHNAKIIVFQVNKDVI